MRGNIIKTTAALASLFIALMMPIMASAQGLNLRPDPAPAGDVVNSGNFIHIVEDLDRTLAFYQELLGAEPNGGTGPRDFVDLPPVALMYSAVGSEFKAATIPVPHTNLGMEFLQWGGVQMPASRPHFYDYSTPILLLFVKDIDLAVNAVMRNGGSIVTPAGGPIGESSRFILVQDPDGYYIEILQLDPMPNVEADGNLLSARFRYTVADADQTVEFYNAAFGFGLPAAGAFNDDAVLGSILGVEPYARSRIVFGLVPGSNLTLELMELVHEDAEKVHQQLPAIGSSIFRIFVRDLDISMAKALAAGAVLLIQLIERP
jgi:predicted enzyme related to lactoylglutathione lyase